MHATNSWKTLATEIPRSFARTVALLVLSTGPLFAQIPTKQVEENLPKDFAARVGNSEAQINAAIQKCEDVLAKYPYSQFAPNVMFQLLELYVKKAKANFFTKMARYEEELKQFDAGTLKEEPLVPLVNFKNAIDLALQILKKYPTIDCKDKILYRLAMCYSEEGNREKAREFFDRLIAETPQSPLVPEVHFRLGEYHFDQRHYKQAIASYSQLLQHWDNPYFDMALYKLGWSYYNLQDYANAISMFIYLIDDVNVLEESKTEWLGKTKADLRREAIDYVAISFTEFGGPQKAREFLAKMGDRDYAILILLKMADVYQKRAFYPEAIATMELILEKYPAYFEAPLLQSKIIECYEKDNNPEGAAAARGDLVRRFGPGSAWLNQYPEGEMHRRAEQLAEEGLYNLGTYYQTKAQKEKRQKDYQLAIESYRDFLAKFPKSARAYLVNYYLAECLFEVGSYAQAAEEYFKVMTYPGRDEFREQAAYNRILAYYQLLQRANPSDSMVIYLDDFLGTRLRVAVRVAQQSQADFLRACNDYTKMASPSIKSPEILMKYGETLYNLRQYSAAVQVYQRLTQEAKGNPYYAEAMAMVAQCYLMNRQYEDAEAWSRRLASSFADSGKYADRATKLIASAQFKQAESLKDQGDPLGAAEAFRRIAETSHDSEIIRAALSEAATQYEKAHATDRAAAMFESFAQSSRGQHFADEALYKAAILWEKLSAWQRAALDYQQLAESHPRSNYVSQAQLGAGRCYENLENWRAARTVYQKRAQNPQGDPDEFIEALFKVGEMDWKLGQPQMARQSFENVVRTYKAKREEGKAVSEYLPARAQFMIGEIEFDRFRSFTLKPPLERNLKRKQAAFAEALKAYAEAAKFKVAEWTTAASYKIGLTFEEFGQAILDAPAPTELQGTALEDYRAKLKEKVVPFRRKALEAYEANIKQAQENKIENTWVAESRKRFQALVLELGLATDGKGGGGNGVVGKDGSSN